ncbi:hypothetical protein QOT17_002186 [Balamuthia mandrillaris]
MTAQLADELMLCIFSRLPAKELMAAAAVCKQWRRVSEEPSLWRSFCQEHRWLLPSPTATPAPTSNKKTWRELFIDRKTTETQVKRVWAAIENYAERRVLAALNPGATEEAILAAEQSMGIARLPEDLRVSLSVHDGSHGTGGGRWGDPLSSFSVATTTDSLLGSGIRLLPLSEMVEAKRELDRLEKGWLPLTDRHGFKQMAVKEESGELFLLSGFERYPLAEGWLDFLYKLFPHPWTAIRR